MRALPLHCRYIAVTGGERLQREARWSGWRSAVGFALFLLLGVYWCLCGFYSRSVVWSGIRYYKRAGRVERVERLQPRTQQCEPRARPRTPVPTTATPLLSERTACLQQ